MPRASFHSRGGGGSDKNKYKPVTKTPSSKRLTNKQWKKAPANKPTLTEKEIEIVMFNCNRLTEESIIELKSLTNSKLVHFMGIIETWYRQDEFKTAKSKKHVNATKKRAEFHSPPPLWPKMVPTWPQLGSENGAKRWPTNQSKNHQKSVICLIPLGIDFVYDIGRLLIPA